MCATEALAHHRTLGSAKSGFCSAFSCFTRYPRVKVSRVVCLFSVSRVCRNFTRAPCVWALGLRAWSVCHVLRGLLFSCAVPFQRFSYFMLPGGLLHVLLLFSCFTRFSFYWCAVMSCVACCFRVPFLSSGFLFYYAVWSSAYVMSCVRMSFGSHF